jgi:hypothetical protein
MTVTSDAVDLPGSRGVTLVTRALWILGAAALVFLALRFFLRDPLHYILDQSEGSFGRYWPNRWWLLLHIAGGTLALFAGPFQFWTGLRRRHLEIHRWTGRLYLTGILLGGGAGFYLSFHTRPPDFGVALFMLAAAWWTTSGMALVAILRRQIQAHREWMIRSYVVTFAFVSFRWLVEWPVWDFLGSTRLAAVGWLSWVVPLLLTDVLLQWRRTVGPVPRR